MPDNIKVTNAAMMVCCKCNQSCIRLHEPDWQIGACYNPSCSMFAKAFRIPEILAVRCPEWDAEIIKLYRGTKT